MREELRPLLEDLRAGKIGVEEALERLGPPAEGHLGFAQIDHERAERCGFPEVVFGAGKTADQAARIVKQLVSRHERVLVTRADPAMFEAVREVAPRAQFHEQARAITWHEGEAPEGTGLVAVLAAGTADLPVAEEARVTARWMGARTVAHYDVGVAGLHRLLAVRPDLEAARALVVVAGMEGALPSVVGGLVDRPVVAVPTSVGYVAALVNHPSRSA